MKVLQSDDLWFYFEENKQFIFPFCWHNLRSMKNINEQHEMFHQLAMNNKILNMLKNCNPLSSHKQL